MVLFRKMGLVALALGLGMQPTNAKADLSEVTLSGVRLGMSKSELYRQHGKPTLYKKEGDLRHVNFGDDHRLEVYLGQDDRVEYIRGGIARVNGTEISLPLVPVEAKKKLPGSQLLDKDPGRVVLYWPTYQLGAVYYDIGDGWLARYSLGTKPRFLQMSNTR